LRARASESPDRTAYYLIADDERESVCSYGDIDRAARAIARWLRAHVAAHSPVLLVLPTGAPFLAGFFGAMYANAIAVPVAPPLSPGQWASFDRIRLDTGAHVVLTTEAMCAAIARRCPDRIAMNRLRWQPVDPPIDPATMATPDVDRPRGDIAYLQYTSGSTADPKGVVVTHGNVLANLADLQIRCRHRASSVGVSWLPHYHDMGLVYGVLSPMFGGYTGVLMSPSLFIRRPMAWLDAMSRHKATHTSAPNFAYDHCVRKTAGRSLGHLDLRSIEFAANGAEPVRARTMARFAAAFEPCGFRREAFRPAYGLAEATLLVTVAERWSATNGDVEPAVTCGRPANGTTVRIVDPERRVPVADGEAGEIWVRGPGVASGYWRKWAESARVFDARVRDSSDGPFLRTGDIGVRRNGELYVTGRLKDVIVVAGCNHHAVDLEQTVDGCHPALMSNGCAAFSTVVDGEECLVVAVEIAPSGAAEVDREHARATADAIDVAVRAAIGSRHGVQTRRVAIVAPGGIPRTSSGKIQRAACRALWLSDRLPRWTS